MHLKDRMMISVLCSDKGNVLMHLFSPYWTTKSSKRPTFFPPKVSENTLGGSQTLFPRGNTRCLLITLAQSGKHQRIAIPHGLLPGVSYAFYHVTLFSWPL